MAGLNTRKPTLAHPRLLNLTKTDLADICWGIAGRCGEGQELDLITEEAHIQARGGDKPMARAHQYLADYLAKIKEGHAENCVRPKRTGLTAPWLFPSVKQGYVCTENCQHRKRET